jgi:hypothetical protein
MARQTFAQATAVADRIAAKHSEYSPEITPFANFILDMTECRLNAAGWPEDMRNGPVMQRKFAQKASDRLLWRIERTSPERVESARLNERAERLAALDAKYNPVHGNIEEFEFDVPDYVTFATNLAEACHRLLGEAPRFLIDEDGEADIY